MKKRKIEGITLIALVVTIIILLILAGTSVTILIGENGLISKAITSKNNDIHSKVYEAFLLQAQTYKIEKETGNITTTLIDYLQEKEILTIDYVINVEKLVGKKLKLGNGTNGTNDVYKLEKIIESAKLASTNKVALVETEPVRYKIVYYGEVATEIVDVGNVTLNKSDLPKELDIFTYEDEAKTILTGVKDEFIKTCTESKGALYYEIIDENGTIINKITIPSGVTKVSDFAFFSYKNLTINLPSSVNIVGKYAFYNCNVLNVAGKATQARFTEVGENAFGSTTVNYLATLEIDYANLFTYEDESKTILTGINEKYIKETILDKDKGPTYYSIINQYNEEINEITIPDGVTKISDEAFFCYRNLTINLPSSVNVIGNYAFYDCNVLNVAGKTSQARFTEVGENAFTSTIVNYLATPEIDYSDLFTYEDEAKTILTGINEKYIKETILDKEKGSPYYSIINQYNEEIKEITIPNKVIKISDNAFFCYRNLTINLPSSVNIIGKYAFYDCKTANIQGKSNLNEFNSVGDNAFYMTDINYLNNN